MTIPDQLRGDLPSGEDIELRHLPDNLDSQSVSSVRTPSTTSALSGSAYVDDDDKSSVWSAETSQDSRSVSDILTISPACSDGEYDLSEYSD